MLDWKAITTPMASSFKLLCDDSSESINETMYHQMIRSLICLTNSFYLHVNALTLKVFLIIISLLVTLSFYPIMHVNYQMTNFLVDQSYHKLQIISFILYVQPVQSFTLDMVELIINFMNSFIHAYACCWLTFQSSL